MFCSFRHRSRSLQTNETPGTKALSNGSIKEPILTRSKSRLRVGRRISGRSPKKLKSPLKFLEAEATPKRKPVGNGSISTTSTPAASPKTSSNTSEKMYARHYKSYRGLNGVSRRGDLTATKDHSNSPAQGKETLENSSKDVRRVKQQTSVSGVNSRQSRTVSSRNGMQQNGIVTTPSKPGMRNPSRRIRHLIPRGRRKEDAGKITRGRAADAATGVNSSSPSPTSHNGDDSVDGDGKDKLGKRRSALWVLNCEAEEFLFGETAAEKHEVELPPLAPPSPPPKKRYFLTDEMWTRDPNSLLEGFVT